MPESAVGQPARSVKRRGRLGCGFFDGCPRCISQRPSRLRRRPDSTSRGACHGLYCVGHGLHGVRDRLHYRFNGLGDRLHYRLHGLRDRLHYRFHGLRDRLHHLLHGLGDRLHHRLHGLRDRLHHLLHGCGDRRLAQGVVPPWSLKLFSTPCWSRCGPLLYRAFR